MGLETFFNHKPMKDIARYLSSQNMATQAVTVKGGADDPDFASTGGAQCIIDGTFVAALTAITTLEMDDPAVALPIAYPLANREDGPQPLAGKIIADDGQFWLLITTKAGGDDDGSYARWAHDNLVAEDDAAPTLKVPYYGGDELTIALVLMDNDDIGNIMTIGTDNFDFDTDCTVYNLIGPNLLPHVDNWDKN